MKILWNMTWKLEQSRAVLTEQPFPQQQLATKQKAVLFV
ncbi:hypothetical protein T03_2931 [Trichinella britovi]|uniref:Uncharacterized protein n=1 Tax=Trichinella britovi TaxID=45882 RepID=A0A0V1CZ05_TRIBR|nr:hypothetical protein T03_2931 [Trichinella britovi]